MIGSFSSERTLWVASVEAFLQSLRSPELREQLAAGQHEGRKGLASLLLGVEESALTEAQVRGLGSIQSALFTGLMTQWLTDPKRAPSSREVMEGLRTLGALAGGAAPRSVRSEAARRRGRRGPAPRAGR